MKRRYVLPIVTGLMLTTASAAGLGATLSDAGRPEHHLCPINQTLMTDPVVASDGHTYERAAIEAWIHNQGTSPFTRDPISLESLVPNRVLKDAIDEWQGHRQVEIADGIDKLTPGELVRQLQTEFERCEQLLKGEKAIKDKEVVVFLGNTGAGKSTVINWLTGKSLKADQDEEGFELEDSYDNEAMAIGGRGHSETLYPKTINVNTENGTPLLLVDLPGMNDTNGSVRNLVNAAMIRKIFQDAKSLRLVFVGKQDQFTSDRAQSVKNMFNKLQQLFVVRNLDFVNEGMMLITGTQYSGSALDYTSFLQRKVDAPESEALKHQLGYWSDRHRLSWMYHPHRNEQNEAMRLETLQKIESLPQLQLQGVNVSALYPPEMLGELEKLFTQIFRDQFDEMKRKQSTTITDIDRETQKWQDSNFWEVFSDRSCYEEGDTRDSAAGPSPIRPQTAAGIIRALTLRPYEKAFSRFKKATEAKRQLRIKELAEQRQARVAAVKRMAREKTSHIMQEHEAKQLELLAAGARVERGEEVLASTTNAAALDDDVEVISDAPDIATAVASSTTHLHELRSQGRMYVDFGYHKDFYEAVCGEASIKALTTDLNEQEIVRKAHIEAMAEHSNQQLKIWSHLKGGLIERLDAQRRAMRSDVSRQATEERKVVSDIIKLLTRTINFVKSQLRDANGTDVRILESAVVELETMYIKRSQDS